MIISRTPLRISFAGGGSDIRSFYSKSYGEVINTSINKFLYTIVKRQIGIVEYKFRINWSNVEFCNDVEEIQHPIVREAIKIFNIDFPIEITTVSDIPANSGLGSSSSFTVGLINALCALLNKNMTKYSIATLATKIEIDILKRNIGKQDHFAATYGNLNIFRFNPDETVEIKPVFYKNKIKESLEDNILLFWTQIKRDASEILASQKNNSKKNLEILTKMRNLVQPLSQVLSGQKELSLFGELLNESWQLKKTLSDQISSTLIDNYYDLAIDNGALGGKILGAGGGGFLLMYVEKENQLKVKKALFDLPSFQFKFDTSGTRITYYDSE